MNIALRRAKSKYFKNLLSENTNSPKKFWKTLKSIFPIKNKSNNSKSFLIENEFTSMPSKIDTGFVNFYTNIAFVIKSSLFPLNNIIWRKSPKCNNFTYKTFRFRYVSATCISKQLKRLKRSKFCGIGSLPPNLLKDSANEITYALTYLVNLSISTATFPSEWKTAKVTTVFKSGNKTDIENYRPISILSVIFKIMECEVHSQLYNYLEEGKLISDFQFSFRKGKSTKQAILTLLDNIKNSVDSGKLVGGCFIDLSKAFDTISHRKLLQKLECYGVQDKELEWFRNYLFDRHIRVCFDGVLSEKRPVFTGVPQGSILGPLLFVIFFNDITENLIHSKIVIYADDTVIFCESKKLEEIEIRLNADLKNLHSWFKENELLLNLKPGKTEVLSFGTSKRLSMLQREIEIKIMNQSINVTNSYKYLGVEIDHSLDLNSHFERTYKKMTTDYVY